MIFIIEIDVSKIPELLQYFIPGYLAITLYRNITGSNSKSEHTILISCAISYILVLFAQLLLPKAVEEKLELQVLFTCGLAVIGAISSVKFVQSSRVNNFLRTKLHYTPTSTVLESCIKIQHPGSTVRVYLKNADYYVEGTISSYRNDPDDPYLALRYYRFYQLDDAEPYYECEDGKKYFVVNLNDALHLEIWETIPANKK